MIDKTFLIAAVLLGCSASSLSAQDWPSRPVRLIVPTGAGSATDVIARVVANEVSKAVGGSVYVDDLPGASGIPAHQAAARATPDGYTFLFTGTSGLTSNPVLFKQLPYDPAKDFSSVAIVTDLGPQMLSVYKDIPVKSLPELIDWAKHNPAQADYAVDITAGSAPVSARLLSERSNAGMTQVPYRSASQMAQDVAAGRVAMMVSSIIVSRPFIETGAIRPIAVFSAKRFPTYPDVPTVAETIPDAIVDGFLAIVAPSGTPPEITARFNRAVGRFLDTPEAAKRLADIGLASSGPRTVEESAKLIAGEQQRWRTFAQELKLEPQ